MGRDFCLRPIEVNVLKNRSSMESTSLPEGVIAETLCACLMWWRSASTVVASHPLTAFMGAEASG